MSLSSLQLDAFAAVARLHHFSRAAASLHITQSALSQRILNLEETLGTTLFVRSPSCARLTEVGKRLLHMCQARQALEAEFLASLQPAGSGTFDPMGGSLRVAGFSTLVRSVVIPRLGQFGRIHSRVRFEVFSREVRDLPRTLREGEADFVLTTQPITHRHTSCALIGHEHNVLVASREQTYPDDVFLDHDTFDTTTHDFWRTQKGPPPTYHRLFFDDIYGIMAAAAEGFGRAVVPDHLLDGAPALRRVPGYKPLRVPIYLCSVRRSYPTRLHQVIGELLKSCAPHP